MSKPTTITVDGNEAVALVAHKINEVIAIYPITPSSPMGEFSDLYSSKGQKNIFVFHDPSIHCGTGKGFAGNGCVVAFRKPSPSHYAIQSP